jgi:hypothetical protein
VPRLLWLIALVAAACPDPAATKWDKRVEKAAGAVRVRAARAHSTLAVDTVLRAAELLRSTHPQLARQFALTAADLLKKSNDTGYPNVRLAETLMAIDPVEGERVARTLPSQTWVYSGLTTYWVKKEQWGRAADLVREAWRKGLYLDNTSYVLGKMKDKRPAEASLLFRDMVALFPEKATLEPANALLRCTAELVTQDPAAARLGLERLLAAVSQENFNSEEKQEMISSFRLGEKTIEAADTRESFVLPIGIYLHSLAPDAYRKHEALFAKWRDEIAALKPDEMAKAARPVSNFFTSREVLAKRKGEPIRRPPPAEKKAQEETKPPFAEAFAKAMSRPDAGRASMLSRLLRRDDLTREQYIRVLRETLILLPKLSFERQRLSLTSDLFEAAADRNWKPVTRPAAETLLAALTDLEKCQFRFCESLRSRGDLARGYETLAVGVRQAHIRLHTGDPSLAARTALLDLRDILDAKYDFTLAGLEGGEYRLRAQRGKVVMLNFWATW